MQRTEILTPNANALYEASLKPTASRLRRFFNIAWIALGIATLIWLSFAEPFSAVVFNALTANGLVPGWVISFIGVPLVMLIRAVIMVESAGYLYHRFFQHLGFMTRRAHVFRRNQRFHWIHHIVIYPIGRLYQRRVAYVASEHGLSLSWVLPALAISVLFLYAHGITLASFAFIAALGVYAKFVVDRAHSRFHEIDHPWAQSPYFQWLEQIHLLHHWDQRYNFTIVCPAMDIIFGSYLSPAKHAFELRVALEDSALTVSDVINWRYLLIEASPVEYAAFVSAAKKHRRGVRKLDLLIGLLAERIATVPTDSEAVDLHSRAVALMRECK